MKTLLPWLSLAGLALVFLPAVAYLVGAVDKPAMSNLMLAGTILWFATAPLWMGRKSPDPAD